MGPLRSGPMSGIGELGKYKTPNMPEYVRAQRRRAQSALFNRVIVMDLSPSIEFG